MDPGIELNKSVIVLNQEIGLRCGGRDRDGAPVEGGALRFAPAAVGAGPEGEAARPGANEGLPEIEARAANQGIRARLSVVDRLTLATVLDHPTGE